MQRELGGGVVAPVRSKSKKERTKSRRQDLKRRLGNLIPKNSQMVVIAEENVVKQKDVEKIDVEDLVEKPKEREIKHNEEENEEVQKKQKQQQKQGQGQLSNKELKQRAENEDSSPQITESYERMLYKIQET